MHLSKLLSQRDALLRQTRLANLAYAYSQLEDFAARIARGGLRGRVALRHPAEEQDVYGATLTSLDGSSQSVIEEHFTDTDVLDLADVIAFLCDQNRVELTFRIEELAAKFLAPLRSELERLGCTIDAHKPAAPIPRGDTSQNRDCERLEESS